MALGQCEHSTDESNDIYPQLHLQGVIDELRDACLNHGRYPAILLAETALADEQLINAAELAEDSEENAIVRELLRLSPEQENLLTHQAQMIVERIKPQQDPGKS